MQVVDVIFKPQGIVVKFDNGTRAEGKYRTINGQLRIIGISPEQRTALQTFYNQASTSTEADLRFFALAALRPSGNAGGDLGGTYPNPTVNDGADGTAIHADVVDEIAAVTVKATPVSGDLILIEDSADSNNKKSITIGTLPGSSDQTSNRFLTAQDFMTSGLTGPRYILINSQVPVREFAGSGNDDEMWGQLGIPERLVGTTLTTKLHYASGGTNVTNFKMWIDYISTTDGEDIGASVTTISEVWAGTGTADEHDIVTFSSTITVAPGEILHMRVYRDPDALGDTNNDGVRFIALEFEFAERQGPPS